MDGEVPILSYCNIEMFFFGNPLYDYQVFTGCCPKPS
jgi:hypothetical protein